MTAAESRGGLFGGPSTKRAAGDGDNPPMQRTGAAGIGFSIRTLLGRGSGH
jgi:hypothetical protein